MAVHGIGHCIADGFLQVWAAAEVTPGVVLRLLLELFVLNQLPADAFDEVRYRTMCCPLGAISKSRSSSAVASEYLSPVWMRNVKNELYGSVSSAWMPRHSPWVRNVAVSSVAELSAGRPLACLVSGSIHRTY